MKKTPLTLNRHKELGAQLKQHQRDAQKLALELQSQYPKSRKVVRASWKLEQALSYLRSALDSELASETSPEQWREDDLKAVYFGPTEQKCKRYV